MSKRIIYNCDVCGCDICGVEYEVKDKLDERIITNGSIGKINGDDLYITYYHEYKKPHTMPFNSEYKPIYLCKECKNLIKSVIKARIDTSSNYSKINIDMEED